MLFNLFVIAIKFINFIFLIKIFNNNALFNN